MVDDWDMDSDERASQEKRLEELRQKEKEDKRRAQTPYSSLYFHFDEKRQKLFAKNLPYSSTVPLTQDNILKHIVDEGYGELNIDPVKIRELIEHDNKAKFTNLPAIIVEIGFQKDASFKLEVSRDMMSAELVVQRGYGGKKISKEDIDKALKEKNIVFGILDYVVDLVASGKDIFNNKETKTLVVAKGKPAIKGENTRFVSLCEDISDRREVFFDDDDVINFRDVGEIKGVNPGDPVAQALAPTEGQDGCKINGQIIEGPSGIAIPFADNLNGVCISKTNPNILEATMKGIPVMVKNGAIVENLYVTKKVNLATGNVEFDGSVHVLGDVDTGMLVKASGDIIVSGSVERSRLMAGGDIYVAQGVFGNAVTDKNVTESDIQDAEHWDMCVEAKGKVTLQSSLNAHIVANKSILIADNALHSCLLSKDHIVVGEGRPNFGIVGGFSHAYYSVSASNLGSKGCPRTHIKVGISRREAIVKSTKLERQIKMKLDDIKEVENSLKQKSQKQYPKPPPELAQLKEELTEHQRVLKALEEMLSQINYMIKRSENCYIGAYNYFHPEVILKIEGQRKRIAKETPRGKFILKNEDIIFANLA